MYYSVHCLPSSAHSAVVGAALEIAVTLGVEVAVAAIPDAAVVTVAAGVAQCQSSASRSHVCLK